MAHEYEITPTEYLVQERAAAYKHEFYKGKVTAMAGASLAHNKILSNLIRNIGNILEGKDCQILPSDIRVTVPAGDIYMYPDAVIVCGKPEVTDDKFDTLTNPVVIFEILSPSTAEHDRVKKFSFYRQIPSFKEYVLIDSTQVYVEVSRRQAGCFSNEASDDFPNDTWTVDVSSDPEGHVRIASIQSLLWLDEVYRNVF